MKSRIDKPGIKKLIELTLGLIRRKEELMDEVNVTRAELQEMLGGDLVNSAEVEVKLNELDSKIEQVQTELGSKIDEIKDIFESLSNVATSGEYSDLSGTPESLPANGGNADTAEKLAIAQSLKVNLASTADVTFDGSAPQNSIPVDGLLPVSQGGTGASDADDAISNLGITPAKIGASPSDHTHNYNDLTGQPSALPNPAALTFTGAVSGSYDGNEAKTINIPTIAGPQGPQGNPGGWYGTCDTAAGTAAKVATLTDATGFSLKAGATVFIKMTATNSIASPTLDVNGTGARPIMRYGTTAPSTSAASSWQANSIVPFTYDGTNWMISNGPDNNTTYTNAALGHGYGTCNTVAVTADKLVTLANYALTLGGMVAVKFTNAVPASATLNINNKGAKPIFYHGKAIVADIITAGDIATFIYDGTNYNLISIDSNIETGISVVTVEINSVVIEHWTSVDSIYYLSTSEKYTLNASKSSETTDVELLCNASKGDWPIKVIFNYVYDGDVHVSISYDIVGSWSVTTKQIKWGLMYNNCTYRNNVLGDQKQFEVLLPDHTKLNNPIYGVLVSYNDETGRFTFKNIPTSINCIKIAA